MKTSVFASRRRGFSAIELLVVVAIIGVVIALLLPAIQGSRSSARRVQCANNLRQLGLGLHNYLDLHQVYPPGYTSTATGAAGTRGPGWAWGAQMLAELEQGSIFQATNFDLTVEHPANQTARLPVMRTFLCPSSGSDLVRSLDDGQGGRVLVELAPASYVGSAGTAGAAVPDGWFFADSFLRPDDMTDGQSNTLAVGERSSNLALAVWSGVPSTGRLCTQPGWPTQDCRPADALVLGRAGATPGDPLNRADGFASQHPGGAQFVFGDGSVRFLVQTLDPAVFHALATRSGGEVVSGDGG